MSKKALILTVSSSIVIIIFGLTLTVISRPKPPKKFVPPNEKVRTKAIGSLKGISKELALALDPKMHFEPMGKPGLSDWLANHTEEGQTYDDFRRSRANLPRGKRKIIYLQPLGDFTLKKSPPLEKLKEYTSIFFELPVKVLPKISWEEKGFKTRINSSTQRRQILSTDILSFLKKRLPSDAYCMLAITMEDLYPKESWNFVFGQASLKGRVGVYSFCRYSPDFEGKEWTSNSERILLKRSLKVLTHEIGHMFNVRHCIYYKCVMNGSNHLKEADSRPIFLCPVDLRKLHKSIGFDIKDRYVKMKTFLDRENLKSDAQYLQERIRRVKRAK